MEKYIVNNKVCVFFLINDNKITTRCITLLIMRKSFYASVTQTNKYILFLRNGEDHE